MSNEPPKDSPDDFDLDSTPSDEDAEFYGFTYDRHLLDPLPSRLKSKLLGYGNLRTLSPPVHCERRLCGFEPRGDEWLVAPFVPFRPSAMMLWDVPERATVAYAILGNEMQLLASSVPVPARFFATGHSFEEVVRRFEREGIDAPYWCDFKTMSVGYQFRIQVRTEGGEPVRALQAVLLGIAALS